LILKPPSIMLWLWSSSVSNTINPPRFDLTMSLITFLSGVPGETNFMKSMKVFSFSGAIFWKRRTSIYMFGG